MNSETFAKKPFFSAVDIGLLFVLLGIASPFWTFDRAFSGFWSVISFAGLAASLSVFAWIRSRTAWAVTLGGLAIALVAPNLSTIPTMFPLRCEIPPASFHGAALVDVLQYLAEANGGQRRQPDWRFYVSNRELGNARVTIEVSKGSTLRQVLDELSDKLDAEYTWNWHKFCGNEPFPLCAEIYLSRGADSSRFRRELLVSRYGAYDDTPTEVKVGDAVGGASERASIRSGSSSDR